MYRPVIYYEIPMNRMYPWLVMMMSRMYLYRRTVIIRSECMTGRRTRRRSLWSCSMTLRRSVSSRNRTRTPYSIARPAVIHGTRLRTVMLRLSVHRR